MADTIAEKSAFMQTRVAAQMFDAQQHLDDLLLKPNQYEQARGFFRRVYHLSLRQVEGSLHSLFVMMRGVVA